MHHLAMGAIAVACAALALLGSFGVLKGTSDAVYYAAGPVLEKQCPTSAQKPCSNDVFGLRLSGPLGTASRWFSIGGTVAGAIITAGGGALLIVLGVAGGRKAWLRSSERRKRSGTT
ncbi:MAG: hypothetical protein ABR947_03170 [Solirubrobacteraceae bacterium]|jgi:hypothetical protein